MGVHLFHGRKPHFQHTHFMLNSDYDLLRPFSIRRLERGPGKRLE